MSNFNEKQQKDLANSLIPHDLAEINISSVDGDSALDGLFWSLPPEERRNDGRVSDKWLRKYDHIRKHGGLAFHGVNPLDGSRAEWISFKPDNPVSPDRKYEQPPHSPPQAFYPAVNVRVWKLVADRYGVPMPDNKFVHFWEWVRANRIPIIITEGCKKALAAMGLGLPCIALTGIWNGVKAYRDENGKTTSYELILSLKYLLGQKIYIAFDRDKSARTIKNVIHARSVLADKLIDISCDCYSMRWSNATAKGLDDFIVIGGEQALEKSISEAELLTGEVPNFKKPMSASMLAERIAKEWKDRGHYYLPTKTWRVYLNGIWEDVSSEEIESIVYNRILEDAPELNSHNYLITIVKFLRGLLLVGK